MGQHTLQKLTETTTQMEALRIHGVTTVRHVPAWRVECSCGWVEKAAGQTLARQRWEQHAKRWPGGS